MKWFEVLLSLVAIVFFVLALNCSDDSEWQDAEVKIEAPALTDTLAETVDSGVTSDDKSVVKESGSE